MVSKLQFEVLKDLWFLSYIYEDFNKYYPQMPVLSSGRPRIFIWVELNICSVC